jgi:HD-like signal output (HDOD) protein
VPQPLQSKDQSIEQCIRYINGQSSLPAFAHHMAEIAKAMGNDGTTLNLLTNLILKNVSLTATVLRAANSIYYNPTGKPVLSVSRAVTMMGWDSIGNLAAGILIFEHFRNKSDKLQKLVLLMMLTGCQARQIAIRSGRRGIEEAYLCGMFRNLGELVVACYLPKEYAKILAGVKDDNLNESESCDRVLKFRYEDLGKSLARYWNLPDSVASCMDQPDLTVTHPTSLEELRIISAFSHELSVAVYRTGASESREMLTALVAKYGAAIPIGENEIPLVLEAAVFEAEDTLKAARLPIDRVALSCQIIAATNVGKELTASSAPAGLDCHAAPPAGDSDILKSLMNELRGILESGDAFDLNSVVMMILEAMYRGAGLDRALFCLVDSGRANVQARLGVGADVEPLIEKFHFPISIRSGPIGVAMLGKDDMIMEAAEGARYSRSVFMSTVGPVSFGILPLVVDNVAVGCLYFDSAADGFTLEAPKKQALLELRNFAATAIARKRKNSA